MVTADLDYPRLLSLYQSAEPSLILFRGGAWSETDIKHRLAHLLELVDVSDFENALYVVTTTGIRRRTLPI